MSSIHHPAPNMQWCKFEIPILLQFFYKVSILAFLTENVIIWVCDLFSVFDLWLGGAVRCKHSHTQESFGGFFPQSELLMRSPSLRLFSMTQVWI